ncbi:hypothetical protein FIBSPDRAFT_870192 [Athelia psychrophila]|uniref:Uncharacterized protein n=1 Tax=Athelia psychrophila TaxID=1759441 RepID=A0A166B2I3_9AGAM|nr:hypothetical protein FIBSPDRAFT_870548 [Fibularhizoctonia sp. CBS 109695]KZP12416.1 hypothetical protein FIBSPDRAFT_870192 [Fibularhizoctonia sp. CBS 109695]
MAHLHTILAGFAFLFRRLPAPPRHVRLNPSVAGLSRLSPILPVYTNWLAAPITLRFL